MRHTTVILAEDGSVTIPASLVAELGLAAGHRMVARLGEGALVVEPIEAAVRRVQALVHECLDEQTALIEDLVPEATPPERNLP